MCSPGLIIRLCCLLIFCFHILHVTAGLNRSHCIAANSDYLEVFAVSIVIKLWAKRGA